MRPIRRRDLTILLGGALVCARSSSSRAQQTSRVPRVGALMNVAADDPEAPLRISALLKGLVELGWTEGHDLQIEYRWGAGSPELYRKYAAELVSLAPDVILATAGPALAALQRETRTIPIVFIHAIDPVGLGYVASLSRPGGNTTGIAHVSYEFSGKWVELLKQVSPTVKTVAVLYDPSVTAGTIQLNVIQSRATSLGLTVSPIELRDAGERDRALARIASTGTGGLIITASTRATIDRKSIIALAAQYRLPAVYPASFYILNGGLVSYGPVFFEQYRRAASYVDRILKGASPATLPVEAPSKFETVLNLKTARALGLEVPRIVLVRADQLIE
jgi:putative ABC transport system substrate-binding protein